MNATAATAEFLRETRSKFSNLSLTALAVMELPTAVVVQSVPVQVCAFPRQAARVLAVSRGDPDGSSAQRGSRGVHKVESMAELERVADELCEETDLLLAQKFLPDRARLARGRARGRAAEPTGSFSISRHVLRVAMRACDKCLFKSLLHIKDKFLSS